MSRVDFYLLSDESNTHKFACIMVSKAWSAGNNVYVYTDSEDITNKIDSLLWTFRDISFIPHEIYNENETIESPVTIGSGELFPNHQQVLINLDGKIPQFANKFKRVIEIVENNDRKKETARERYRQYKKNDYEIHNHKIDNLNKFYQS